MAINEEMYLLILEYLAAKSIDMILFFKLKIHTEKALFLPKSFLCMEFLTLKLEIITRKEVA